VTARRALSSAEIFSIDAIRSWSGCEAAKSITVCGSLQMADRAGCARKHRVCRATFGAHVQRETKVVDVARSHGNSVIKRAYRAMRLTQNETFVNIVNMKNKSKVVAIRLPSEVVELAEKNAAMLGVSLNMLLANIVVTGLGCEMLEHGLLSRILREALMWMREHGHPDAPVPPALLPLAAERGTASKTSTQQSVRSTARKAKRPR